MGRPLVVVEYYVFCRKCWKTGTFTTKKEAERARKEHYSYCLYLSNC